MSSRRWWVIGLLFIFLVSTFLIHSIRTTYMRDDEEIALRVTSRDLAYAVQYQAWSDVHPPLYFIVFWFWGRLAGDSEFASRLFSILLSIITLALIYRLSLAWFKDPRVGIFAIAVLGVNAYFFTYALEIRPYALILLIATFSMWAFHRWLMHRTPRTAVLYGLSLALMLYLHYFMAFLVVAQWLYLLFTRPARRTLNQLVRAGGIGLLFWLPWLPIFINQVIKLFGIESAGGQSRGLGGIGTTTQPTNLESITRLLELMTNGQIGLYVLVLLLGIFLFWRKSAYRLAFLWGIGVPLIALIINLVFAVYTPRYISYLVIGFGLLLGLALVGLPKRLRWGGLAVFVAISLWALPSQLPKDRIPFRDLLQNVAANAQPGDVIFFDNADLLNNVLRWQIRHYLPRDLWNNRTEDAAVAAEADRVWFVTADWFDPNVRANFDMIESTHPLQIGFGDCNRYWCYLIQLLEAPTESNS